MPAPYHHPAPEAPAAPPPVAVDVLRLDDNRLALFLMANPAAADAVANNPALLFFPHPAPDGADPANELNQ